jgi:hypothetical protein
MNSETDVYDDILKKIPNILSHIKFLSPDKTADEEKAVLEHSVLTVENCGDNRFGLNFNLPDYIHAQISDKLIDAEASLMKKAESVIKYFPNARILYVKVKRTSNT